MTAVGGPIDSISFDGRLFSVAGDADSNRKLGGSENDVQPNGDGTARMIKTAVSWKIDGLSLSIDDFLEDQEFLQSIADKNGWSVVKIIYASGAVYQGSGTITGETQVSSANTVAAVEVMGTGVLTLQ